MIYFIQNEVTGDIKIGYSKNPKKRLGGLQTATPQRLILLGAIPGDLQEENDFHSQFAKYTLRGEWFKVEILEEVLKIITQDTQQEMVNVVVWADSHFNRSLSDFCWRQGNQLVAPWGHGIDAHVRKKDANKKVKSVVFKTLNELHAKTPIGYIITGGRKVFRQYYVQGVDLFAQQWAAENGAGWRSKNAVVKRLHSMFDHKLLLVFSPNTVSNSATNLMRRATKAGIEATLVTLV